MARRKSEPVQIPEGSPLAGTDKIHVFWPSGMSCDGCTTATLSATTPSLEQLLWGAVPGVPTVILHHPMLSEQGGELFMEPFRQAASRQLDAPYIVVLEGSVPDDQAFPSASGYFSALGTGDFESGSGDRPTRMTDWLYRLAPGAAACVAIGTCATWGGIPAAAGDITGSMGLMDFLGEEYRSG